MERINYKKSTMFFIVFILCLLSMAAFNVFYRLGNFPIYSWDEARHGVSAFEMIKSGNFIINKYRGHFDYWNLKPPLSFWAIILGYKIAGFNELGLRICSAIFSMGTITMIAVFLYKKQGKLASIISTLVLATCTQYITNHSSRTGDADSLFVFLFTVAILSLMLADRNLKWLYGSGIAFSLAFLTKSWHAGNIVVIMGLFLFFTKKYKTLSFKNWMTLCMFMILPIVVWGVIRYQYDGTKFFKNMIFYDLLHRSTSTIEHHTGGMSYYINILSRFSLLWGTTLIFLLFLNKGISFKRIRAEKNDFWIGITLWVLVPFILFTVATTKVRWYILPIYPALSIIIGTVASQLLHKGNGFIKVLLSVSILSVAAYYEMQIAKYINYPPVNPKQSLIEKVKDNARTKGDFLYIYQSTGKVIWLQSEVLTAELADNLKVENGGLNDFLRKQKALILIPREENCAYLLKSNRLKIIASNNWGYMAYKQG
ncbi:ArnT family glycosyltransferase [Neobacillus cucumis]|uniref:ArnT family glycosyltransferase n=2 Tax=Neobacillus cucumis TaxID=1740721 RepID=UPI001962CB2C|nr:glycosyltransferase family 39 protein [Neobacillus cucumis]